MKDEIEPFQKLVKTLQLQNIIGKTDYKFRNPIYVNMVREPVNRIISWYYYVRAPWYIVQPTDNGSIGIHTFIFRLMVDFWTHNLRHTMVLFRDG